MVSRFDKALSSTDSDGRLPLHAILEKEGVLMLKPIHRLIFEEKYLALTRDQIKIFYKKYQNANPDDMQEIIEKAKDLHYRKLSGLTFCFIPQRNIAPIVKS